jgi:hypothetical protein
VAAVLSDLQWSSLPYMRTVALPWREPFAF